MDYRDFPKLYELAKTNTNEHLLPALKRGNLRGAFPWSSTPQGHFFWERINNKDFSHVPNYLLVNSNSFYRLKFL